MTSKGTEEHAEKSEEQNIIDSILIKDLQSFDPVISTIYLTSFISPKMTIIVIPMGKRDLYKIQFTD